ncbi:MAG: OsmC family protein [Balneolaceae bacterium]
METTKHSYETNLSWIKGKTGKLSSEKVRTEFEVATPPEFPGGVEGMWSPEHLFIASASSCFMTTFLAIAEYSKLEFENLDIHATGTLGKPDGKFEMTEIILKPKLVITNERFQDKAYRILEKAEAACLITRSMKTEVKLEPEVVVGVLD